MKFFMHSGRLIDIENFKIDDVDIEDISHHLSKEPRFNNATPIDKTYSVGEHSINLVRFYSQSMHYSLNLKYALLHDASEAYLKDMPTPIKAVLQDYKDLEGHIQNTILTRFMVPIDKSVKEYDKRIMLDEVETIMPDKFFSYQMEQPGLQKLGCHVAYNNHPSTVKQCFLTLCKELGIQ